MATTKPSLIRQLFTGTIDDEILFPYPTLSAREDRQVSGFVEKLRAYLDENLDREWIDENERIPPEILNELKRMGLFGVGIPAEFGGMGLSQPAYTRVFEFITGYDVGLAIILGVHLSIGIKGVLLAGSPEQKAKYLPKAATGEWMASFALTEPHAGSDVAGIRSRAERQADGSYLLNGSKIWIGNGSFSEAIVAFAQLPVEIGRRNQGPGHRVHPPPRHAGVPARDALAKDGSARLEPVRALLRRHTGTSGESARRRGEWVQAGDAGAELRPHGVGGWGGGRDQAVSRDGDGVCR